MSKPAIFLDRDGVINKVVMRGKKEGSPRTLSEWQWEDGVVDAVNNFKQAGYLVFIVTNQPDIARELMTQETLDNFHKKVWNTLPIDDLMFCPHDNHHNCHCRKPKPGMLLDLAKKWDINLANSYMVGDRGSDIAAGKSAGCKTVLLSRPYNQSVTADQYIKVLKDLSCLLSNNKPL